MSVKFKRMSISDFHRKHDEACEALEEEDVPQTLPRTYGEVKIPGHGWHPCVMGELGEPAFFYSDDDGWQACPRNVDYEEV